MTAILPPERIRRISGFGMSVAVDAFVFQPQSVEEILAAFQAARASGRKAALRAAARSYGDAAILAEEVVIDLSKFNRILSWDPSSGIIETEPGATLADIWRHTLPDGWWLPVVSGTMRTSIGGALAMNIHGKNNWMKGPIGEHVIEIDLLNPLGKSLTLTPKDELFYAIVSGLGLLGVVTRVKLQMKRVESGNVRVEATACKNWDEQFAAFEKYEGRAEYVVTWIDVLSSGASEGRGTLHAAWHVEGDDRTSLQLSNQDLPARILGFFPKSAVWRILKLFNNRPGMKLLNAVKHYAAALMENGKTKIQSLAKFNFLLDYVPGWEKAYLPGGLIQCQFFIPKPDAKKVFSELFRIQQREKLESYLAVMKRHRTDRFLMSHAVDGYSLALDFKVTSKNRERLFAMAREMNDLALKHGGRFYFAKDSTLTEEQAHAFLGEALTKFRIVKHELDPEGILTSALACRLGIG